MGSFDLEPTVMLKDSCDAMTLSWLTSSRNEEWLFFKSEFGAGLYTPAKTRAREYASLLWLYLSLAIVVFRASIY